MIPQWLTQDHANLKFSRLLVVKDPNITIVYHSILWYIIVVGLPLCSGVRGGGRCCSMANNAKMSESSDYLPHEVRVGGSMSGTLNFLLRVILYVKHGHLIPERANPTARKTWTLTHHNFEKSSCMQDIHDRLGAASKSGKKSSVTQFRDSMKGLVLGGCCGLRDIRDEISTNVYSRGRKGRDAEDSPCILPA